MTNLLKSLPALAFAAAIALSATSALANTAANTQIINKARLTYSGGSAESSSIVTVALIPATPNVTITRGDAIYTGVGTPTMPNTVSITATANGPASYTVTPSVIASTNTKGGLDVQPGVTGGTSITIGASVTTGVSGATWVTVPESGAGSGAVKVNEITAGDTIVFKAGGVEYSKVVTSLTDNADGTYRINYNGSTNIATAGTQVGELAKVALTASPGTILLLGDDLTTTVQAIVSTGAAPFGGAAAPSDNTVATTPPNKWTSTSAAISFFKYSRNVYNAAGNVNGNTVSAITYSINSVTNTYYRDGVTGKPGDTIEYIIKVTNSGANINGSVISDQLPVASVSDPITVAAYGSNVIYYSDTDNNVNNQTLAAGSLASFVSPNLSINVGVGALGAPSTPGTIPTGKSVTVGYQVTVK